jgi:chorismate mutase/prephenate dehydratase
MKKSGTDLFEELKGQRKKIDLIDRELLNLLNRRLRIALEAGKIKKKMRKKIYDPKREKEVLGNLRSRNKGPLKDEDLKKIFSAIIRICRRSQV